MNCRTVALSFVAGTLLLGAACGGSSDDNSTNASASRSSASTTTTSAAAETTTTASSSATTAAGGSSASGSPDVTKPCSFITAAEVSTILGVSVTAADEGFRCKYNDGSGGWLQVELNEMSLKSSQDSFGYAKAHGKAIAGLGDESYLFGAATYSKIGDVFLLVDGDNLSSNTAGSTDHVEQVARTIVSRIP